MKRKIYLFACMLAGVLLVLSGCNSSDSSDAPKTLGSGEVVKVSLLQTSDVHHHVTGTGASATYTPADDKNSSEIDDFTKGGYARIANKVYEIREDNDNQEIPTLLVDSGDFLMGTIYDLTMGSTPAAFKFMEEMEYDAITLGNHEFDYGPKGLTQILEAALGSGDNDFTVPIVATNMVPSDKTDAGGIKDFMADGVIQNTLVKTLPNGLKIGVIGLLGSGAEKDAPLLKDSKTKEEILSFHNDMTLKEDVDFLQAKVDDLKNNQGVHLVIALSHSGVTSTDRDKLAGDDIDLAQNVAGIDIIASGHEHKMIEKDGAGEPIKVPNGDHVTYIICPGQYGENLSRLDITFKEGEGVQKVALVNYPIDDKVRGDYYINDMVETFDSGINSNLADKGLPGVNDIIGASDSDNLAKPEKAGESGMGNLVADSLRYLLKPVVDAAEKAKSPLPPTVGIVANGVIRSGFDDGQKISLADMYSVLPLGMTVDPKQQSIPGYPLVAVYLTGEHIKNVCQLAAYVEAAEDDDFMAAVAKLAAADQVTYGPLYAALSNLGSEYYLNLSGVRYAHNGLRGDLTSYKVDRPNVAFYGNSDYQCQGPATTIDTYTALGVPMYPVVVDLYVLLVMQDKNLQAALKALGIPVTPLDKTGSPIPAVEDEDEEYATILSLRIDSDSEKEGIQETKEWMALLNYLTSSVKDKGLSPQIDDSFYASDTIDGDGVASRVNTVPLVGP